jgi:glycosyltransferase involved in cell wall biosynthesis
MPRLRLTLVEFNPSGGLFQFALQMGEAMAELGHDVELVTGRRPELLPRVPGMRVAAILPTWHAGGDRVQPLVVRKLRRVARLARYLAAWGRLLTHLLRQRPDVVQWSEWRFPVDGWLVAWLARRPAAPAMALVAHNPRPLAEHRGRGSLYKSNRVLRRALAAAYRRMDVVFVLGAQSARDLAASWPGLGRVEVIPHGDEGVFLRGPVPPVEQTPARALFFGDWGRHKGLDLLLDAFGEVRRTRPEAELVVAGAVRGDVDFQAIARRAERAGNVRLQPGYVPAERVAELVGSARVLVCPYRIANQSGVVHLAHTFARPVIASDVGDLPDAVADGHTGLLVPPDDPGALTAALERLLSEPAEAARLGRAGRERLEREASWPAVAAAATQVYEAVLANRRPASRAVAANLRS